MRNSKATQDARLILQLGHLREDAEMRKARRWWRDEFWPRTAGDYLRVEMAHGTQQNRWLRQVATYWGMAASFVLDQTLSEKAFFQPPFSDEMCLVFAKIRPFLKQLRDRMRNPEFMLSVEKVILSSRMGRERLRETEKQIRSTPKGGVNQPAVGAIQRQGPNREGIETALKGLEVKS